MSHLAGYGVLREPLRASRESGPHCLWGKTASLPDIKPGFLLQEQRNTEGLIKLFGATDLSGAEKEMERRTGFL